MTSISPTARRSSKQRDLIVEIVRLLKSHPSAEEVYYVAKGTMPNISLGTVYRNLRLLASEGTIREVQFETGPMRFDGMVEDHEHFVCQQCGTVLDIPPTPALRHAQFAHPELRNAQVTGYSLSYYGICPSCKKSQNDQF